MTKETIEGMLTRIAFEFDRDYFNNIGMVVGVKFARFFGDWRQLKFGLACVTFGMFDSRTRVIYLNAFFHKMLSHGLMLREVKAVIFHELCHGALVNSMKPVRFGMYDPGCTGGHGEDFQALERRYPEHISHDKLDDLMPVVIDWMRHNVPEKLRNEK